MPFLFSAVTDLLQALEDNAASTKTAMKGWLDQKNKDHIVSWIKSYKITVDSSVVDAVAVLSALFPDKRTDRVYKLQAPSLSKILGRCFRLGTARIKQLDQWKTPGNGDLGLCVERTLRETEHGQILNPVTLDEIDSMLHTIASKCRFSAPGVQAAAKDDGIENSKLIDSVYRRLSSKEAKWLTRIILKDFSTLDLKSYHALNAIDPGLADAMNVYSTFGAAVDFLRDQKTLPESQKLPTASLKPTVGSKIGRVPYLKGRSVKHVVKLAAGRRMSVEQKYDGEYCQIHIDLTKGDDCIRIFSKSGKESTKDRQRLHKSIKQSLRVGEPDCCFKSKCIVEGEMVVYSEQEGRIMDFHKIRKHVSRSGSFLGTELDSQAHEYEHLMMVYYDVMLVDDDVVMNSPHSARRRCLQELVTCGRGLAIVSKQKTVDFSSRGGPERLRTLFATAITHRWEGLVIKPSDEPYFGARQTSRIGPLRGWIKLKKDYIPGLGDSADFAVVGAGYDASRAAQLKNPNSKWTHFHLGCLRNKKEVKEKNARPYVVIVGALDVNADMTKHLNQHGQFCALPFGSLQSRQDPFEIDIEKGVPPMNVIFRKPFVLDVVGAGFDKEGNRRHYTLRFPRALRIHSDRDWRDSVSLDELQSMAKLSRTVPADTKTEVSRWEQQLEQVDRGTKGSHVPWDLSDDDVDAPAEDIAAPSTGPSTSKLSRRRSSVAAPMIRMDTQEINDKEERLDSGEVVERPSQRSHISNWSDSNLPTPPPSSPTQPVTPVQRRPALAAIQGSSSQSSTPYSRQALSSCQSTVSTDRSRKRSTADDEETPRAMTSKRRCVSPPIQQSKANVCDNANNCQKANLGPLPTIHNSEKTSTAENFLVPKLSIGAAEALRSKRQPRMITDMERTSPDRQTTEDEASTQDTHSTQQSLMDDWHLQNAEPQPMPRVKVPDLRQSHIVLSADVSGMPYLTEDLLTRAGLDFQTARQVFPTPTAPATVNPNPRCKSDRAAAAQQEIIMLVEGRRHDSTLEMMKFLVGRITTDASQIVWVFDWRLAEDMCARKMTDDNTLLDRRLVARFWYGGDGELRWLSDRGEIHIVPRENIEESRGMDTGRLVKLGAVGAGF
ncbi:MAG: hypothetical protein LQ339_002731 [Xanthoria mediterranea]|nr:MAG: hypothetical protein LQ339_002731 [Xanthoria mediterranea]